MDEEQNKLIMDNMPLVTYIVKKYFFYDEDYISVGKIGLIKAVKTFDKSKGYNFSTYASKCIYNEIAMSLRNEAKKAKTITEVSYDNKFDDRLEFADVLPDTRVDIEKQVINDEQKKILIECVKKLKPKEKFVVVYSYGLFGKDKLTQKEIASKLNCTQAHISRLLKSTLKKLRKLMEG